MENRFNMHKRGNAASLVIEDAVATYGTGKGSYSRVDMSYLEVLELKREIDKYLSEYWNEDIRNGKQVHIPEDY